MLNNKWRFAKDNITNLKMEMIAYDKKDCMGNV